MLKSNISRCDPHTVDDYTCDPYFDNNEAQMTQVVFLYIFLIFLMFFSINILQNYDFFLKMAKSKA